MNKQFDNPSDDFTAEDLMQTVNKNKPMDTTKQFEIWKKGFLEGKEHQQPSRDTLKLFNSLDSNLKVISERLNNFIDDSKEDRLEILDRLQRINGSVDGYLQMKEKVRELENKTKNNTERIEKNTNSRNMIIGGLIVLNVLIPIFFVLINK